MFLEEILLNIEIKNLIKIIKREKVKTIRKKTVLNKQTILQIK